MAFLWTASGIYNVAASKPHWALTEAIIAFGLGRSVATHSLGTEVPGLDSPDQIRLGAAHFEIACAFCHGSPDSAPNAATTGMLPPPPNLDGVSARWEAQELAWIIEHGLKYTGMPAWPVRGRHDEVWSLVSFLRALPMVPEAYRTLAGDKMMQANMASPAFCAICHRGGGAEQSHLVPLLTGQSEAYLARALREYAAGSRPSGIMGPIARALTPEERASLATAFADMPMAPFVESASDISSGRGARIAWTGLPARDIPACLTCHGGKAREEYPVLAGLPAPYIAAQLRLWQQGGRARTGFGALMGNIANRLSSDDIQDVSEFFARQGGRQ
jgi:cytochrome c553